MSFLKALDDMDSGIMYSFAESKAQFFDRWFKLVELVQSNAHLKIYMCIINYSDRSVARLEYLSGIECHWCGVFATAEQLPFVRAAGRGNLGVFEIAEAVDDINTLNAALFSSYGSLKFIVITDEEDFFVNIKKPILAYFQGQKNIESLVDRFLVGNMSLVLSFDEIEESDDVEGWFNTKNSVFQNAMHQIK